MNELLPCPFCGSGIDNSTPRPFKSGLYWIARCGNPECSAEIVADTEEKAVSCWNRRAHQVTDANR